MSLMMVHPEIEAPGWVIDKQTFRTIWAPRGWELASPAVEFANSELGHFVRSTDELTLDETRGLIARKDSSAYPDADATGAKVQEIYNSLFSDQPLRPSPATETPSGVPIKLYDPAEKNVDEVKAHLATVDEAEQERILAAEKAGKNRVTITSWTPEAADSDDAGTPAGQEN
jgi:hypothetical protein